jgi:hypothetical protein
MNININRYRYIFDFVYVTIYNMQFVSRLEFIIKQSSFIIDSS